MNWLGSVLLIIALCLNSLGSTNVALVASVAYSTELRYYPYGNARYNPSSQVTTYRFTGQRWDSTLSLYDYRARYYDPMLGRFISADPLVPQPGNP